MDSVLKPADSKRDKICDRSATEIPLGFPAEGEIALRDPVLKPHGLCFWTRAPLDAEEFALDHVMPRSFNGPDNLFNLVPTSAHLNGLRGNAWEAEAGAACLSIIRMTYGPRSLILFRARLFEMGEPEGRWWCVDECRIRRPRLIPYVGHDTLIVALERSRVEIAALVRPRERWVLAVEFWLSARRIHRAGLADVRRAWCVVATADRAE